ncbi:MAG TPA: cobalt ECF transporter T component CbiQ [Egibacteraceae bacterium]|nr:cobalt ECF transporter T component CbiQ [Egibacteraceae bacterium]
MGAGHAHALYVHEHSPVHRLPPEVKVAAAFAFAAAVAVTPREQLWAFAVHAGTLAVTARVGRLRAGFVATRMLVVLPFIAFAFLIPFVASGDRVDVLGVAVSREGLWGAWNILVKALLGVTVSILLAATTPIPDILRGLERLRVPAPLTTIAMFMVRYLELVAAELGRTRTAMAARGYNPRWLWQSRPLATAAGAVFIRTYERGERVHAAMLSRGYRGAMPALGHPVARARDWRVGLVPAASAAVIATIALVAS